MRALTGYHRLAPAPAADEHPLARLAAWLRSLPAAVGRRARTARTMRALYRLDNRTLTDIGMHRSEIMSVAAEQHGGIPATRSRIVR